MKTRKLVTQRPVGVVCSPIITAHLLTVCRKPYMCSDPNIIEGVQLCKEYFHLYLDTLRTVNVRT